MISKIVLTRDEICELVASVLKYNKKMATVFEFKATVDDQTILKDFYCEISCEAEPIKVRVVPEDDLLNPAMDSAARMIDQWRMRRQEQQPTPSKQL